jgi:DNA-binding SARP family transcriptional activator
MADRGERTRKAAGGTPVVAARTRMPTVRAMVRERLDARLAKLWEHRLTVVTAPAGAGKTTLLAHFTQSLRANGGPVPVAWYRAEPGDGDAAALLGYLEQALTAALGDLAGGWASVEDAARDLERWSGERALLVIDDLHALQSTPAETALGRLLDYAPPYLTVLVASRYPPNLGLSRLRVAGQLLEIDADDLRFRSWEVERLFREFYAEPLPPEDLAALARRTEGWAAGLQLFHLATRGKRADERRQTLHALGSRWRLVREYLTDNVLGQLSDDVRDFLVGTCVLGRLSGAMCDELLGRTGSEAVLAELERAGIFTVSVDQGWYRYHEVLRSHLEAVLVEQAGEAQARAHHARAAQLLEASGELAEALCAYCRADDWEAAGRLLGHGGAAIADGPGAWLDRLPPAVLQHDPWILLATARRHRADGRWDASLHAYRAAEGAFGSQPAREVCAAERRAVSVWMEPALGRRPDAPGLLRAAVARDPLSVRAAAADLPAAQRRLVETVALALAGDVRGARISGAEVAEVADASPLLSVGARLLAGFAALLGGDQGAAIDVEWSAEEADRLGVPWIARVGRAVLALTDRVDGPATAAEVRMQCVQRGDEWGAGLAALVEGIGGLRHGQSRPAVVDEAARGFARLGAGSLEAWCHAVAALQRAHARDGSAARSARQALAMARSTAIPGAEAYALLALSLTEPEREGEHLAAAGDVAQACGLALPDLTDAGGGEVIDLAQVVGSRGPLAPATGEQHSVTAPARANGPPPSRLRCFGGLELAIHGRLVDLRSLKPRARALLRVLALHAGRPVHREAILAALWPDTDGETGTRNLHVTLSALRNALEPEAARNEWTLIVRDGDAYVLRLGDDADVDLWQFDRYLSEAATARAAGDNRRAIAALEQALWLHEAELLPEEGPAEWVVGERERYRVRATEAAKSLVELLVRIGDRAAAVIACARGLHIDRYQDALWRMLIAIHQENGDPAAAAHARRRYDAVLAELGLTT